MVGSTPSRRKTVLCLLLLALVTALFFHRVLLHPEDSLSAIDLRAAQGEYKYVQWHSISDWGRFPLWDPTIFCGKSIVGDSLPAVLNPPQWIFWLTPSPVLFGYLLWFYATVGAWGMFLFASRKGCDPYGAMLAAVVFVLGGKTAGHLFAGHMEVLATVLCLPWIMLAAEGVLEKPSCVRAGLLGGALALASTCGSVQFMYWHFLFVGAYASLWLLAGTARRGWRATARSAFAFMAGVLSFLLFAAPWWLPVVGQTLILVARARGAGYGFATAFSPEYSDLLHLVWPFHGTTPPVSLESGGLPALLAVCFWEKTVYVGLIPLALLLPACLWPRKNRPVAIILVILMALSFALGLGSHGPLFWWATRIIPGFTMFRCPGRLFFYTAFSAALLVGLFVSEGGVTARKWMVLAVSGALLAAVTAGALLLPRMEGAPIARVWLPVIILALFVPVIVLWMRGVLSDNLWKTAVLLLVCCDLFVIWQDHIVVVKTEDVVPGGPVVEYLAEQRHREEFRILAPGELLGQTRAAKYGLEIVCGYHPGIYGRYLDLYKAIWTSDDSQNTNLQEHTARETAHPVILDLMNVAYRVAAPAEPKLEGEKTVEIPGSANANVYRRDTALPRVCIVPGAEVPAQGTALLDALCSMDPRAGCLVEDRPFHGGDAFKPLMPERKSPSDVTLQFKSEKGGVVVISQAWHPDWRATDHGLPVEVRRVNYGFVGICVNPGDHAIRVWYWPWDFYLGCYVAATAWASLAIAGAWAVWRKTRPAKAA